MANEVVAILRDAREFVARPGGWTQGEYARDASGDDVDPMEDSACCWCASGALWRTAGRKEAWSAWDRLSDVIDEDIAVWNDAPGRTQSEVVAAFDRAIAAEEAANGA